MRYDLIIIGGGMVGAGLAVALRDANLRIALIDARAPSNADGRLFALNAGSCQFLSHLRIWQQIQSSAAPIHQVHVSHKGHFGVVRLNREEAGLSELGHVIPARHIEASLNNELTALPNITLFRPAALTSLRQTADEVVLQVNTAEGEQILYADFVIGADGTESTVRTQLNIPVDVIDYQQTAIVTRTRLSRSHGYIAYERFCESGAIAMLPLTNDECATIWTADNPIAASLLAMSDKEFTAALQKEFGYRLGRLQGVDQRYTYPLKMVCAKQNIDRRVMLVGNAAHTLHPIAAQGFNLALYEAATLVDVITSKQADGRCVHVDDFQLAAEQVQKHVKASMSTSHRLSVLFSGDLPFMSAAAQLGMAGMDVMTPVKKNFIQRIMGKTGYVPRLLRNA